MTDLLLRQAHASRAGAQGDDDYDVIGATDLSSGRSPLPGNGSSWPEKNTPIRRPTHGSAVSETKRSYKKPANSGPFSTTTGNLRTRTSNQAVMSEPRRRRGEKRHFLPYESDLTADFRLDFQPQKTASRRSIRPAPPAVADRRNELLMTLVVPGCFQCSAGKQAVPTGTVAPLPIKSQL
jgi:hypothetical protein